MIKQKTETLDSTKTLSPNFGYFGAVLALFTAPLVGLLYVLFLPLCGFGVLGFLAAKKISALFK